MSYRRIGTDVEYEMSADTDGWVAVGFSSDKKMVSKRTFLLLWGQFLTILSNGAFTFHVILCFWLLFEENKEGGLNMMYVKKMCLTMD